MTTSSWDHIRGVKSECKKVMQSSSYGSGNFPYPGRQQARYRDEMPLLAKLPLGKGIDLLTAKQGIRLLEYVTFLD